MAAFDNYDRSFEYLKCCIISFSEQRSVNCQWTWPTECSLLSTSKKRTYTESLYFIYLFYFSLNFFDTNIIEYTQWGKCTQLQVISSIHRHTSRWSYTAQVYSNKDTNKSTHAISLSTYKTKYIRDPCRKAMLNNRVL